MANGNNIWIESEDFQSAFQYDSIYKYTRLPSNDDDNDDRKDDDENNYSTSKKQTINKKESFIRNSIIFLSYSLLLFTFPISAWFCLKRVKPLERCIIYRLGKRLPIIGPGLVIRLPLIDVIDFIDLRTARIAVIDNTRTMLTADRSIIECGVFDIELNILNVIQSVTKMKDARSSSEHFVRTAFVNMISSTHIDEIECKLDYVIKKFIHNCNSQLNCWGWQAEYVGVPEIKVLQRSDPTNPVIQALKGYFTGNSPINALLKAPATTAAAAAMCPKLATAVNKQSNDDVDELIEPLQTVAGKYTKLKHLGYQEIFISITIKSLGKTRLYQFDVHSGEIKFFSQSLLVNEKVHVNIVAENMNDFLEFIRTEDAKRSKVAFSTTLF